MRAPPMERVERLGNRTLRFMPLIYEVLFTTLFLLSAPFYFVKMWRRGNWRQGFWQRFGRYSNKIKQNLTNRQVIWLHAVSVGEVNLCTQLIAALEHRVPNMKLVVSTTTSTGMQQLQRRLPSHIQKIYYPIDRRKFVARAFKVIRPKAVVLVEAEIWPNFLWAARRRRIPVFLVNARLSERSYRGYLKFLFFFRPLFALFKGVGVQDSNDYQRFRRLGCPPEALHVLGNLKFDAAPLEERRLVNVPDLLRRIGVASQAPILLGGSTHRGEEGVLADEFLKLREAFPSLFLILVPRHFERGKEVGQELAQRGIPFIYRSDITSTTRPPSDPVQCLVVNSTGELRYFYEYATVIFIGKSLTAHGGQNPLEAGQLGKPIIVGPHMENFAPITEELIKRQGAWQIETADQLREAVASLLRDENARSRLGQNALTVVQTNRGAIDRSVDMIVRQLPQDKVYVAPGPELPNAGS